MKKLIFILVLMIFVDILPVYSGENKDIKVSNSLFSIAFPYKLKKTFSTKKKDNGISVYHKASKKAGFGGFAFGIRAYEKPSSHAMLPGGKKIGELVDKRGKIYDIVLKYPTDVQYDYNKNEPEEYKFLYDLGETIDIKGVHGAKYYKDRGTKGEDLYKEVLNKHLKALEEKWDSARLENENISYMYNVIAQTDENLLDKIGYAFYDANGDGIDELFIGEIANNSWKGVVYDIYTMVNRKPAHVISGGTRNRYFVCDETFLCNEYFSGAEEKGWLVYVLIENSTQLYPQVGFKYDGYENKKNPWFLSYDFSENVWENVSEQAFKERKAVFDEYKRFNYIPFSKLK